MPSLAQPIRELTDDELGRQLLDAKEELFNLRFQLATGKQDNSSRMGRIRRDIARIHTVLREREIEAAERLAAARPTGTEVES